MGQVAITLNGRTYRLVCGDGEEDHLANLAGMVKFKIESLRADVGNVGDERLMLMAALLIADELVEARDAVHRQSANERDVVTVVREPQRATGDQDQDQAHKLRAAGAKMATGTKAGNGGPETANKPLPPAVGSAKVRRHDVV
jgi:cell division protein ZapA